MYAVIQTGGKQYRVEKNQIFRFEKLPGNVGDAISFDKVLMFSDGQNVKIGTPVVEGIKVQGCIVEQDRAKKVIVFKFKSKKRYRKKQGHRQYYTAVRIDDIGNGQLQQKPETQPDNAENSQLQQKAEAQEVIHGT